MVSINYTFKLVLYLKDKCPNNKDAIIGQGHKGLIVAGAFALSFIISSTSNHDIDTMPIFRIYTNTPKSEIPDGFLLEASSFIAKQLGKPESYVTVRVHPEQMMCHGGSTAPCASVELLSLGSLGPTKNSEHAKAISDFIEKQLKIPRKRFFINFVDLDASNIALGGETFG